MTQNYKTLCRLFLTGLVLFFNISSRLVVSLPAPSTQSWDFACGAAPRGALIKVVSRRYAANRMEEAKNHSQEALELNPSISKLSCCLAPLCIFVFQTTPESRTPLFIPPLRI